MTAEPAGAVRPLAANAVVALAQRGAWLLMLPVYLAVFTPEQFGELALLLFVAAIVTTAANLRLDSAMRTFYFDFVDDAAKLQAYLRLLTVASTAVALLNFGLLMLLGPSLFALLFAHDEIRFWPGGAIAVAAACANACIAPYLVYLRNSLQFEALLRMQLSVVVSGVILQIAFISVLGSGIVGALLGAFIPSMAALLYVIMAKTGWSFAAFNLHSLMPSLRYSAPLVVFGFFYMAGARLDTIVLERHVDLQQLGAYAMLVSILGSLMLALNVLDNAVRPILYPALRRNNETTPVFAKRVERLYMLTGCSVLSIALLLGSGLGWLTADPAYLEIRRWLLPGAMAVMPEIITRYYALYFDFHKRSLEVTYWTIARTSLMFLVLLLVVPRFGIAGALSAVFLSQLLNAVGFALSARRKFSIRTPIVNTLLQAALFAIIISFVYLTIYW